MRWFTIDCNFIKTENTLLFNHCRYEVPSYAIKEPSKETDRPSSTEYIEPNINHTDTKQAYDTIGTDYENISKDQSTYEAITPQEDYVNFS